MIYVIDFSIQRGVTVSTNTTILLFFIPYILLGIFFCTLRGLKKILRIKLCASLGISLIPSAFMSIGLVLGVSSQPADMYNTIIWFLGSAIYSGVFTGYWAGTIQTKYAWGELRTAGIFFIMSCGALGTVLVPIWLFLGISVYWLDFTNRLYLPVLFLLIVPLTCVASLPMYFLAYHSYSKGTKLL